MKTKTQKSFLCKALGIMLLIMALCLGAFSLQSKPFQTNADNLSDGIFIEKKVDNGKFAMTLTANARKQVSLPLREQNTTTTVGEEINYLCFNWRDLEHFKFSFSSSINTLSTNFKSFKFLLTNLQTDDLTTSIGVKEPEILFQSNIINNKFDPFDFYYYVDKNIDINESATRSKGNDFGIYKFDFVYTYMEEENEISVSIGDLYIAVLPDDIDSIPQQEIKIMYAISSSNKLMNVFNLYLSNDSFKYVNPKFLKWVVVGIDQMNVNYVLTQKMKDENLNYANHKVVWQTIQNTNGTSFIFDSNDIEGTWTAYCIINNSNGTEKMTLSVNNLSTIKIEKPSYVWLILLIVSLVLVLGGIIGLIVFRKKRDKVW